MKQIRVKPWFIIAGAVMLFLTVLGAVYLQRLSGDGAGASPNSSPPAARLTVNGKTVYVYGKKEVLQGNQAVPLVLFMNGTGGDPQQQAEASGWAQKAAEEDIIVLAPVYNDYATYSEVDDLLAVIEGAKRQYPIDSRRVYSLGFSNGGATSVALAARHPELLAGIAAYGWQVDLTNPVPGYPMPFQVIQGTEEATEYDAAGQPMVRRDTAQSIRSLLLYNDMITDNTQPDYAVTPYWGYAADSRRTEQVDGVSWTVSDYLKQGYSQPLAQFILIDGADHRPHPAEADYSWEFLRHFSREADGRLTEQP